MNHRINAFKHFKINYSKKRIKGKRNNRNQDDREKKIATTSIMFYESGRKIRVQIHFSSYNPA